MKSYGAIHMDLRRKYGPAPLCINHHEKTINIDWANVTGVYTSDIEDYLPMCKSCHKLFDFTEETRAKLALGSMGNTNAKRVRIGQYKDGLLVTSYDTISEACRKLGILNSAVSNVISGRSKSAGGYEWRVLS